MTLRGRRGCEPASAAVPVAIAGRVILPDGQAAEGALVVSSAGGLATGRADGSFRLEVEVAPEVKALELTAVDPGLCTGSNSSNGVGIVW